MSSLITHTSKIDWKNLNQPLWKNVKKKCSMCSLHHAQRHNRLSTFYWWGSISNRLVNYAWPNNRRIIDYFSKLKVNIPFSIPIIYIYIVSPTKINSANRVLFTERSYSQWKECSSPRRYLSSCRYWSSYVSFTQVLPPTYFYVLS